MIVQKRHVLLMLLRAYRTAVCRVNMLKDNIERVIEEIELMIYGLKEIDKNTI
jgi:hypothetical protein